MLTIADNALATTLALSQASGAVAANAFVPIAAIAATRRAMRGALPRIRPASERPQQASAASLAARPRRDPGAGMILVMHELYAVNGHNDLGAAMTAPQADRRKAVAPQQWGCQACDALRTRWLFARTVSIY
jgi:hypothetical protein